MSLNKELKKVFEQNLKKCDPKGDHLARELAHKFRLSKKDARRLLKEI